MSVPIGSATAHRIKCLSAFLVASFRFWVLATEMSVLVPAQQTVVPGFKMRSRNSRAMPSCDVRCVLAKSAVTNLALTRASSLVKALLVVVNIETSWQS